MSLLFVDEKLNIRKSWQDFFDDLANFPVPIGKKAVFTNYYEFFLGLIYYIATGWEIEIDDFASQQHVATIKLISAGSAEICKTLNVADSEALLHLLKSHVASIFLYSSGTIAKPHIIRHTLSSLTRGVRTAEAHRHKVWASTYNPTHIGAIQVFFQALFTNSTIINLFSYDFAAIPNLIDKYQITHISATPTFYRILIANLKGPLVSISRLSFSGERIDQDQIKRINRFFPGASVRNIYASTEFGTLLTTKDEFFVLDHDLFKIANDGELLVKREVGSNAVDAKWLGTGDLVSLSPIDGGLFSFVGRKGFQLNVCGYVVDTVKIEKTVRRIPFVIDAAVVPRRNQESSNLITLYVVANQDLEENITKMEGIILNECRLHLNKWELPRIIKFVKDLPMTRSGKRAYI